MLTDAPTTDLILQHCNRVRKVFIQKFMEPLEVIHNSKLTYDGDSSIYPPFMPEQPIPTRQKWTPYWNIHVRLRNFLSDNSFTATGCYPPIDSNHGQFAAGSQNYDLEEAMLRRMNTICANRIKGKEHEVAPLHNSLHVGRATIRRVFRRYLNGAQNLTHLRHLETEAFTYDLSQGWDMMFLKPESRLWKLLVHPLVTNEHNLRKPKHWREHRLDPLRYSTFRSFKM